MGVTDDIARIRLEQALERVRVMESIIASKEKEIKILKGKHSLNSVGHDMTSMMLTTILTELDDQPQEWFELADDMEKLGKLQLLIDKLKSQKQQAESIAEIKADFLANMSHEIRTPMNGIMGLTRLLLNTDLTQKQSKYLKAVESSADTLLVIINDILDLSKIEAGKLSIEKKSFSLSNVLSSLVNVFEIKATEKGIDLVTNFDEVDFPPVLQGDAVRLNQILYNLVGNAIKFTPQGVVAINLQSSSLGENSYKLKFTVSDTGIGMTAEQVANIFSPFNQASSGTARKYGGTGLGLTIVKRLVELQGGEVFVESTLGIGSEFSFELQYEQDENAIINKDGSNASTFDFSGIAVLLVEDNPVNQMVAEDLLAETGAFVKTVANGEECLAVFNEQKYSIVLMDMQMPVMNGYDAIINLRKQGFTAPIIALTAHTSQQEHDRCIAVGANDYLSKPYKPKDLFGKIKVLIGRSEFADTRAVAAEIEINKTAWDPNYLKDYVGGSQRIFDKILNKIESEIALVPDLIATLAQSGGETDLPQLLHKIKPNIQMLGNLQLYQSMAELERFCDNKNKSPEFIQLVDYVCSELNILSTEIKSYKARKTFW